MVKASVNLVFHGIGVPERAMEPGEEKYWVSAETFRNILDGLPHQTDLHITFDDGNLSDMEIALPCLVERGLRATFFICAGRLGMRGFLGKSEVRQLAGSGMMIGSHGMNHIPWRGQPSSVLDTEIVEAKDQLEQALGQTVSHASCPFAAYGRRPLVALRKAGFTRVYTSDAGWARPDAWLQPRNTIRADDTPESVMRFFRRTALTGRLIRWGKSLVKQYT